MADPITIYCFPGQGSDRRIFESLTVTPGYELKVIEYGTPDAGMTMNDFARRLSEQIDTSRPFVLVGVSLGGMICAELNEILNPEKTIIISSAKNSDELPMRYQFQKSIPLYKLFPGSVLHAGAKLMQPIVEPDRRHYKETFQSMLSSKDPVYMERTVDMIINWDRNENTKMIYHIHGAQDHTLPIRKIKSPTFVVERGSHMMTLTRAKDVSQILNSILEGEH
jgi:pimeloyl-ACP methyl ester carboxylesterase